MLFYLQVKENSYKAHQELQLHMEYANKPNKCYEPIHLHLAHQQRLKKELAQSERTLQKLGNFAHLINQMILQSLVTVIRDDVIYFLKKVLKVTENFNFHLCSSVPLLKHKHSLQKITRNILTFSFLSLMHICLEHCYNVLSSYISMNDIILVKKI